MALKLEDKKVIVAEVNEAAGNALSAVIADYRGYGSWRLNRIARKSAGREGISPCCPKYSGKTRRGGNLFLVFKLCLGGADIARFLHGRAKCSCQAVQGCF